MPGAFVFDRWSATTWLSPGNEPVTRARPITNGVPDRWTLPFEEGRLPPDELEDRDVGTDEDDVVDPADAAGDADEDDVAVDPVDEEPVKEGTSPFCAATSVAAASV